MLNLNFCIICAWIQTVWLFFVCFFLMGGELIDMNTIVNSFSSFHVQISKSIVMPKYYIFVTKRHKKKELVEKRQFYNHFCLSLSKSVQNTPL